MQDSNSALPQSPLRLSLGEDGGGLILYFYHFSFGEKKYYLYLCGRNIKTHYDEVPNRNTKL